MAFDCSSCLANCKADCCHGPVPFEKSFVEKHTPIRPIRERVELGDNAVIVLAIDERYPDGKHGVCPFLGFDDKCSVYKDRPAVCRKFGDGTSPFMTCSFQAPDGRVRSRQERRQVERQMSKRMDATIARAKDHDRPLLAEDVKFIENLKQDQDFMAEYRRLHGDEPVDK